MIKKDEGHRIRRTYKLRTQNMRYPDLLLSLVVYP